MSRKEQSITKRLTILFIFFLLATAALIGRLFSLQIIRHKEFVALASKQRGFEEVLIAKRGEIYFQDKDGNLFLAAGNKEWKTLVASPRLIKKPKEIADTLGQILGIEPSRLEKKLSKTNDPYEVLAKRVDLDKTEKISGLSLEGVSLIPELKRTYPLGRLASNLLGFVGANGEKETGQYGLERFFDQSLRGEDGFFAGEKDAAGYWIALGKKIVHPPENGKSLILTIDPNIQSRVELELAAVREKWSAQSGHVLVLEPKSGRVLALASWPNFDPNEYAKTKNFSDFLDPAVESQFELGSVMKPITMAAGLEAKVITPDTTYTDSGEVKIKGYKIQNFDQKAHGMQTMTQVLEKSLNTGAVFVGNLVGHDRLKKNLENFGFGKKTGVDLPNEAKGDISNLSYGREIDYATATFGQGIAVTPLQLAAAIGAIANQGVLMRPYMVDRIRDDAGGEIKTKGEAVRPVISKETAETLTKMLVAVVRGSFDKRADVKGYFVAGKTGTAQIPSKNGRGYSDKVIHTFVGYAPAFDPKFLILIQLNEPQGNRFAANTLTPTFHNLAEYMLNYYEIPPGEKVLEGPTHQ